MEEWNINTKDNSASEEFIQNVKEALEKTHGREFSWEEARQAAWDLENLARIATEATKEEFRKRELLKEFPKGFYLDCKGTCLLCDGIVQGKDSWYDKYGVKCITCQKAINEKFSPPVL